MIYIILTLLTLLIWTTVINIFEAKSLDERRAWICCLILATACLVDEVTDYGRKHSPDAQISAAQEES